MREQIMCVLRRHCRGLRLRTIAAIIGADNVDVARSLNELAALGKVEMKLVNGVYIYRLV